MANPAYRQPTPTLASPSLSHLSHRYAAQTAIHGMLLLLLSCLWDLLPPSIIRHPKTFVASHHMGVHQAELLFGLAFLWRCFPPPRSVAGPTTLRLIHWLTIVGSWANPLGYAVVALSGQGNALMPHAAGDILGHRGPWSHVSYAVLAYVTAPSNIIAFSMWLFMLIQGYRQGAWKGEGQGERRGQTERRTGAGSASGGASEHED